MWHVAALGAEPILWVPQRRERPKPANCSGSAEVGVGARLCENAQELRARKHYFLYCLCPIVLISAFIFQVDEIEKEILRAISDPAFSHLG